MPMVPCVTSWTFMRQGATWQELKDLVSREADSDPKRYCLKQMRGKDMAKRTNLAIVNASYDLAWYDFERINCAE